MRRTQLLAAIAGAALVCGVAAASAQVPVVNRTIDSTRNDTLARRAADTLSTTDRLLEAEKQQLVRRPVLPTVGTTPIQPLGGRTVFTRDSIDWAAAEDLGELLDRIPGVFLERSDWIASPVLPNYFGHGAGSVEYVLDGVPWLPIGPDSVASDPSTLSLEYFERVEVEQAPGMLRVFLFTRRHDRAAPRTMIGVSQGDRSVSRYYGDFERRYGNGIGLGIAADYIGIAGQSSGNGGGGDIPSGWIQLGYVPTARAGIQAQLMTRTISRNLLLGDDPSDTLSPTVDGSRTDAQVRAFWRQRADELGPSVNLFAAHTSWSSDSTPQQEGIGEFGLVAATRAPTWSAQLAAWHYTRWTTLDSRLDAGWSPTGWVTGSVQLVAQRYSGDRRGQWVTGRLGIKLPLGFHADADVSQGHRVPSPSIDSEPVTRFTDAGATLGFASRLLSADGGYLSQGAWRPESYPEFAAIAAYAPFGRTQWATAHIRFAPVGFFTLETVYQHPLQGAIIDGTPPHHAITTATLRSRFRRNFPSGIFDLKLQVIAESWGQGIGGRAADSSAITLPGATFYRAIIQMQIGPFIAYYDRENLTALRSGYVPGYRIQPLGSTFGVRWVFSN